MTVWEIFLIGVGLSMDAFAVSVVKGLQMERIDPRALLAIAVAFGGFQALMPIMGWFLGSLFAERMMRYGHWIAFALLMFIGGKMVVDVVRESREKAEGTSDSGASGMVEGDVSDRGVSVMVGCDASDGSLSAMTSGNVAHEKPLASRPATSFNLSVTELLLLAVATSIDALAVGVTFSFLSVAIVPASALIGCTTFGISAAGVWIGHRTGTRFRGKAQIAGGIVLMALGIRMLLS